MDTGKNKSDLLKRKNKDDKFSMLREKMQMQGDGRLIPDSELDKEKLESLNKIREKLGIKVPRDTH